MKNLQNDMKTIIPGSRIVEKANISCGVLFKSRNYGDTTSVRQKSSLQAKGARSVRRRVITPRTIAIMVSDIMVFCSILKQQVVAVKQQSSGGPQHDHARADKTISAGKYAPYHLLERKAYSGSCQVWKAFSEPLQKNVCIKVVKAPEVDTDSKELWMVQNERKNFKRLEPEPHPHIVEVYECGNCSLFGDGGRTWYVMEYCAGGSLHELCGELNEREWSFVLMQVLFGLESLHARNLLHNDVKPDNLLQLAEKKNED